MERNNILITGGCGFLGKYLIKDLQREFNVTIIDLSQNEDIRDYDSIKSKFKNIDIIIIDKILS